MTSTALANLRQVNDESLQKFMDRFGQIVVQIQNLNPEVALHSLLLHLWRGICHIVHSIQLAPMLVCGMQNSSYILLRTGLILMCEVWVVSFS